ncbi:reverse transcriptase domain-containing protein [Tanacetum coccineum]
MREVHYHDWLSNPVMVKKSDNWRMCVDFKDLNKSCPKDGYPLPEIDWKVESLCGFPFKCFLDAYKGFHQIQMAEEDKEKTVPRVSVKGQVLADFIMERPEEDGQGDSAREEESLPVRWTLFTDGSSYVDGCGAGVILTDPEGVKFTYALRFQFETTNNEAEYEALIAGLRIAEKIGLTFQEKSYLIMENNFEITPLRIGVKDYAFNNILLPVNSLRGTGLVVERANRSFWGEGNKSKTRQRKQEWIGRHRSRYFGHTVPRSNPVSNGDTPFSLTYGTEAVIPAEIGHVPTFFSDRQK